MYRPRQVAFLQITKVPKTLPEFVSHLNIYKGDIFVSIFFILLLIVK
jgi:hypothetical protein